MAARARQRTARAESVMCQARSSRGSRDCRAREAEAAHQRRVQGITDRKDKGVCKQVHIASDGVVVCRCCWCGCWSSVVCRGRRGSGDVVRPVPSTTVSSGSDPSMAELLSARRVCRWYVRPLVAPPSRQARNITYPCAIYLTVIAVSSYFSALLCFIVSL